MFEDILTRLQPFESTRREFVKLVEEMARYQAMFSESEFLNFLTQISSKLKIKPENVKREPELSLTSSKELTAFYQDRNKHALGGRDNTIIFVWLTHDQSNIGPVNIFNRVACLHYQIVKFPLGFMASSYVYENQPQPYEAGLKIPS